MRWVRGIFRFLACGVTCEDKLLERHVNVTYAFGLIFAPCAVLSWFALTKVLSDGRAEEWLPSGSIFAVTTVSFVCFAACGLRGLRHRYTTR
jgi:hypothetical protein